MLWCAQVDSRSKAKHQFSSGLSRVSNLPEAEPSSPKKLFQREGATNKEPNKAFKNGSLGQLKK